MTTGASSTHSTPIAMACKNTNIKKPFKTKNCRDLPGSPVGRTLHSRHRGTGSTLGRGTAVLQDTWSGQGRGGERTNWKVQFGYWRLLNGFGDMFPWLVFFTSTFPVFHRLSVPLTLKNEFWCENYSSISSLNVPAFKRAFSKGFVKSTEI